MHVIKLMKLATSEHDVHFFFFDFAVDFKFSASCGGKSHCVTQAIDLFSVEGLQLQRSFVPNMGVIYCLTGIAYWIWGTFNINKQW